MYDTVRFHIMTNICILAHTRLVVVTYSLDKNNYSDGLTIKFHTENSLDLSNISSS